jgi:tyrosinase
LELHDFLKDKDLTNIYLLAMNRMMKRPQDQLDSWFQISAIHGRPYIPYDNVGPKGTFRGYCCHSSTLFPPSHRPYLALLEQTLHEKAKEVACEYTNATDRERYIAAAERFHLPCWDWAIEAPLPDIVATEKKVKVYSPPGVEEEIDNPLYGYNFNPVYDDFGDGMPDEKTWESWERTVRYPTTTDSSAEATPEKMQATLKNNQYTLRDRVYNLLTQVKNYDKFSHDASGGVDVGTDGLDSIESIHNQMHLLGGNNGHMGVVDYASFDPIFWLHHANVDRIFALWQALNPDQYVTPLPSQLGTFTRFPGEPENETSLLTPFRKPSPTPDTFWTANEVRDTKTFNYTYPELQGLDGLSAEQAIKRVRRAVNELYGKTSPASAMKPSAFKDLKPVEAKTPHSVNHAPPKWHGNIKEDQSHFHDWFVNIQLEKYAVKQSCNIYVFIGDVPADPEQWGTHPNLVGSHCIFANRIEVTGCGKCHSDARARMTVGGTIPLTHALANHFGCVSVLEPEAVVPFLKEKLSIRVRTIDGQVIDTKDIPSLKVITGNTVVETPASADQFPVIKKVDIHIRHH